MERFSALFLLLFFCSTSMVFSFGNDDAGTSAAVLLSQPQSARLLAMGGAGTAASTGAQSLGWNPANLTAISDLNAELSFRRHFMDTELGFITLAWPTSWGVPAFGITYAQTRNITGYDQNGLTTDVFATREMDMQLAWAMSFDKLHLGLAGHYLIQDLHTARITGWGIDIGGTYQLLPRLNGALSVLRIGKTELNDPLGMEIRTGLSIQYFKNLIVSADMAIPWDNELYFSAGAEWTLFNLIALRFGWHNGPTPTGNWSDLNWLSAGIGIKWNDFSLDYLFEPAGFVEDVHHITLGYQYTYRPKSAPTPKPQVTNQEISDEPITQTWSPKPLPLDHSNQSSTGHMRFLPKPLGKDYKIKELEFTITSPGGRVIKRYRYIGSSNIPREVIWDGTDQDGNLVQPGQYSYQFNYLTNKGPITTIQQWPVAKVGHKLKFNKKGEGIEPQVLINNHGLLNDISTWSVTIYQQGDTSSINVIQGQAGLPKQIVWDGKKENGKWANPNKSYMLIMQLTKATGEQLAIQKLIEAIPAKKIRQTDTITSFKIIEVEFGFRQIKLTSTMIDKLDKAIEIYKKYNDRATITIEGHADKVGNSLVNNNISQKRALEVRHYFYHHGIPSSWHVDTIGYGEKRLLLKASSDKSRQKNRRVEIVIEIRK